MHGSPVLRARTAEGRVFGLPSRFSASCADDAFWFALGTSFILVAILATSEAGSLRVFGYCL